MKLLLFPLAGGRDRSSLTISFLKELLDFKSFPSLYTGKFPGEITKRKDTSWTRTIWSATSIVLLSSLDTKAGLAAEVKRFVCQLLH